MTNKVIIIGKHPLWNNLLQQYNAKGYIVDCQHELTTEGVNINDYDEICLLADEGEDDKVVAMLADFSMRYDIESHDGNRLICHMMLQSNKTLQMLKTCNFCDAVRERIDVYPFSLDEEWCRSIILDYEPITIKSEKHIHLVIFGMNEIAEMVAIQAAHIAHYPNYIRDHSLRTRITMIDTDAEKKCDEFVRRYRNLFNNSFYRIIKPTEENAVTYFHKPMYDGKREEFVDVEWEFVEAENWNTELHDKLILWAKDNKQVLTVVLANEDLDKNKCQSLLLPQELYQQSIPIYIYGERCIKYDIALPLVRMAKNVNYIYDQCYNDNVTNWNGSMRFSVEINTEERERSWAKLSNVKRMSSIYNAMTIPTKMRSMGLKENEWDQFYDIPQQDIEILAQVEHNRWCVEELILGFRPCTDKEQEIITSDVATQKEIYKKRKIHYDLRAYNDLRPDKTGRSVQIYDLCLSSCLPLIAKAFADEEGGEV